MVSLLHVLSLANCWTTTTVVSFGGLLVPRIGTGRTTTTTAPENKPRRLLGYAHRLYAATSQQQQQPSLEKTSSVMSTKKNDASPPLPLCGDFAGFFATYDLSGTLIPVPEFYVPDSLLEWGQAPDGLEVLVSEDDIDFEAATATESSSSSSSSSSSIWKRYELTVLPETGCGIDNLEVLQRTEEIPVASIQVFRDENIPMVRTLTYSLPSSSQHRMIRIESTFALRPEWDDDHDSNDDSTPYRSRLAVDLLWDNNQQKWKPQAPLRLFLERQTSLTSSQGTRADGGGLDGRTVSTLIGRLLRQYEKQLDNKNHGKWETATHDIERQSRSNLASDQELILLPGNVTLAYGQTTNENEWCLQIGQIDSSSSARLVVEHTWSTSSNSTAETLSSCSNVHYWKEQGSFQIESQSK